MGIFQKFARFGIMENTSNNGNYKLYSRGDVRLEPSRDRDNCLLDDLAVRFKVDLQSSSLSVGVVAKGWTDGRRRRRLGQQVSAYGPAPGPNGAKIRNAWDLFAPKPKGMRI